ncbi:MAG TPA: AI-2E family transporter [Candidatus Paceibacterota bacterium]|nr:AI-2E family transporter [Candidatus Paceibacterota bacterium]
MEEIRNIKLNIGTGTIVKVLVVLAVAVAIYLLQELVLVLLTSVVIASAVSPATNWLSRYKVPRVISVLLVYVISFGIILGTLFFLMPPLFEDFSDIAFKIPSQLNSFLSSNPSWNTMVNLFGNFSTNISVQDVVNESFIDSVLPSNVYDLTKSIFSGLLNFILIVVISFYLAVQKNGVENFLRVIIPNKQEDYIIDLWRRTEKKIGRWIQGQLLLAIIIGPLVFLGLTLFQVKYALTLAIVASVFEIIPIFGPILASVPAIMLGFGDSVTLGLIIMSLYIIIQQFENHLLYPLVVKKIIGVNPLIVIISLVVGYELFGFLGLILSIPLATLLMEFVNDLEKSKHSNV